MLILFGYYFSCFKVCNSMNMSSKMHLEISYLFKNWIICSKDFFFAWRSFSIKRACGQMIHHVISWSNKFSCKIEKAIKLPFEKSQNLKMNKLTEVSVFLRVKDMSLNGKWWFGEKLFRCSLIRDFNVFLNFAFFRTWSSDQCSFFRTTSLLVFVVPKTVSPFWYDG